MLKALLIDDEEIALDLMEILLNDIGGIQVVGKFMQAADALKQVEALQPDVIFLDIEMPGMNGLTAAEQLMARFPVMKVIFVTAYHQYALDAFEVNARDYLLKPVSKERLIKSLDRFRSEREERSLAPALQGTPSSEKHQQFAEQTGQEVKLQLHVLGSIELYDRTGELVSWRTKKTKELFAYLWHHNGAPVYRLHILDALWPQLPSDRAQALLHTTMYRLRSTLKALGFPDIISFADERYRLQSEWISSDYDRIKEIFPDSGSRPLGPEKLLSLYRGDYMETESYGWAHTKRLEIRTAYRLALEESLSEASSFQKQAIWRKLIELDPYTESYYYDLLVELKRSGNVQGMQVLYREMEERWKEDLGIDVHDDIQELVRR